MSRDYDLKDKYGDKIGTVKVEDESGYSSKYVVKDKYGDEVGTLEENDPYYDSGPSVIPGMIMEYTNLIVCIIIAVILYMYGYHLGYYILVAIAAGLGLLAHQALDHDYSERYFANDGFAVPKLVGSMISLLSWLLITSVSLYVFYDQAFVNDVAIGDFKNIILLAVGIVSLILVIIDVVLSLKAPKHGVIRTAVPVILCLALFVFVGPYGFMDPESDNYFQDVSIDSFEEFTAIESGKDYHFSTDIDAGGATWVPMEEYSAVLDGRGHTISNLTIVGDSEVALFLELTGTVKNLNFENVTIEGSGAGTVAYNLRIGGSVENVSVSGTMTSNSTGGGIVAINYGTITSCTSDMDVNGYVDVGGIAGHNVGTIDGCTNNGEVTAERSAGGIAGNLSYNGGLVRNCVNNGHIESVSNSGGIVGIASWGAMDFRSSTISGCTNNAAVDATEYSGGIIGYMHGAGGGYRTTVSSCANYGDVTADNHAGGISGYSQVSNIRYCSNYGDIHASVDYAGGISGQSRTTDMNGCENNGNVSTPGEHLTI